MFQMTKRTDSIGRKVKRISVYDRQSSIPIILKYLLRLGVSSNATIKNAE